MREVYGFDSWHFKVLVRFRGLPPLRGLGLQGIKVKALELGAAGDFLISPQTPKPLQSPAPHPGAAPLYSSRNPNSNRQKPKAEACKNPKVRKPLNGKLANPKPLNPKP